MPTSWGIERLVGDQSVDDDVFQERFDTDAVMMLAGQMHEFREIAERIDQRRDLGDQAAAGLADGLIFSPLLRPCHADARA